MDIGIVTQLISNLGFPIACVVAMFFMWNKERQDHKEEIDSLRKENAAATKEVTAAIDNNTVALTHLVAKLDTAYKGSHE